MPSATITLHDKADNAIVMSLVGQTSSGALYKDASRSLSLPRTLEFSYQVGAPGTLGNDKLVVTYRNAVTDGGTPPKAAVLTAKLEVSAPRNAGVTSALIEDAICAFQDLVVDANAVVIADAMVP